MDCACEEPKNLLYYWTESTERAKHTNLTSKVIAVRGTQECCLCAIWTVTRESGHWVTPVNNTANLLHQNNCKACYRDPLIEMYKCKCAETHTSLPYCRRSWFWQPPPPHSPAPSVSSVKSVSWPPVLRPLTFKLYSPHQTGSRDRVKNARSRTRTKKKEKTPDTLSEAFMILLL